MKPNHKSLSFLLISFAFILLVFSVSCKKEREFSDIPEILSIELIPMENKADVVMVFTDGDGDFGLGENDLYPPYNVYNVNAEGDTTANKFHYNIFIDYEVKQDGLWQIVPLSGETDARAPLITPQGQNKQIKATFTYHISPFDFATTLPEEVSQGDTIRYAIQIADRALHLSNRMATNEYVIP